MDFGELLKKAWADVQAAELPGDLQAVALTEGIRYYLDTAAGVKRPTARGPAAADPAGAPVTDGGEPGVSSESFLAAIEHETGVSASSLEELTTLVDGKIHINLPRRVFKGTVISNARTIMTFVVGARRYGLGEKTTTADYVKDVLTQIDLYDSKNFKTKHITEVPGATWIKPQNVLQAKSDLHQKFADAAQALLELGK